MPLFLNVPKLIKLDMKTGLCESNSDSRNEIYYKCKVTNEDATACEECLEGATLGDDGLCALNN